MHKYKVYTEQNNSCNTLCIPQIHNSISSCTISCSSHATQHRDISHYHLYTVCALIFAGFNVRGFRGSAAIREYFVREYLNVTVNGHVHSSSQLMTSCVTKIAISRRRSWLLLPVTSQDMDPRCRRKSVQTHEILRGTWPTF